MTHTGTLIREHRERSGLAQAELARRAGVNVNQLNKYERQFHSPSLPVLERIARALEVRLDQLVPAERAPNRRHEPREDVPA
jgi:transcriptional regulator with XRE-family HTH domain